MESIKVSDLLKKLNEQEQSSLIERMLRRSGVYIYAHELEKGRWKAATLLRWLHIQPVMRDGRHDVVLANLNAVGHVYARARMLSCQQADASAHAPIQAIKHLVALLEGVTCDEPNLHDAMGWNTIKAIPITTHDSVAREGGWKQDLLIHRATASALTLLGLIHEWPYFLATIERDGVATVCCAVCLEIVALTAKAVLLSALERLDAEIEHGEVALPRDPILDRFLPGITADLPELRAAIAAALESISTTSVLHEIATSEALLGDDGRFGADVPARTPQGHLLVSPAMMCKSVEVVAPELVATMREFTVKGLEQLEQEDVF